MAFFTRTKTMIPVLPSEEGDEVSGDEWEEDLEERRTPDGRSSKTSFERRDGQPCRSSGQEVVECKNPCLNVKAHDETDADGKGAETKTDLYEFVVDRALGVQV